MSHNLGQRERPKTHKPITSSPVSNTPITIKFVNFIARVRVKIIVPPFHCSQSNDRCWETSELREVPVNTMCLMNGSSYLNLTVLYECNAVVYGTRRCLVE